MNSFTYICTRWFWLGLQSVLYISLIAPFSISLTSICCKFNEKLVLIQVVVSCMLWLRVWSRLPSSASHTFLWEGKSLKIRNGRQEREYHLWNSSLFVARAAPLIKGEKITLIIWKIWSDINWTDKHLKSMDLPERLKVPVILRICGCCGWVGIICITGGVGSWRRSSLHHGGCGRMLSVHHIAHSRRVGTRISAWTCKIWS